MVDRTRAPTNAPTTQPAPQQWPSAVAPPALTQSSAQGSTHTTGRSMPPGTLRGTAGAGQPSYGTGDSGRGSALPSAGDGGNTAPHAVVGSSDPTASSTLYPPITSGGGSMAGLDASIATDDPEYGGPVYTRGHTAEDEYAHIDEVTYGVCVENMGDTTRNVFIRKVHGIVFGQLAVALGFTAACLYSSQLNHYCRDHSDLMYLALVLGLVVVMPGFCFIGLRDVWPWTIVIVALFTVLQAFLFGVAAAYYDSEATMQALSILALVTLSFFVFTLQTTRSVRGFAPYLVPVVCAGAMLGFGRWIWPDVPIGSAVWSAVISAVIGELIVYDTLLLLHRLTPEQYCAATLSLYFDQPNLVLHLLSTATRHTRAS